MKKHKIEDINDLLAVAERNDGSLLFEDNYGKFWIIEQLKRANSNMTVSQTCVHEWHKALFDKDLNMYTERICQKCGLRQRWLASTGEWANVGREEKDKINPSL